jgi:hypothetical protein
MGKYTKLNVEGSSSAMRAFLVGWCAGRGMQCDDLRRRVLWPEEWNIRTEGTFQGIVDAILPGGVFAVLLDDDIVDPIVVALEPWEKRLELGVKSRQHIRAAYFKFEFEIFSRDEARAVRAIFESVPDGVNVSSDYQPEERSDLSASGAEMYAPVHDYEFRGKGTIGGELRGVLEVHERTRRHERIKTSEVGLQLEP